MASSATINNSSLDYVGTSSSNNVANATIEDSSSSSSALEDLVHCERRLSGIYNEQDSGDHDRSHSEHYIHMRNPQGKESGEEETVAGGVGADLIGQRASPIRMSSTLKRPSSAVATYSPPATTQDSISTGVSMASGSQERTSTLSKKRRKQSNPVRLTANTTRVVCDPASVVEVFSSGANNEDEDDLEGLTPSVVVTGTGRCGQVVVESSSSDDTDVDVISKMQKQDNEQPQQRECGCSEDDEDDAEHELRHRHHRMPIFRCLHCGILLDTEDQLRDHVEEEHVQRALEQQLHQQHQQQNQNQNLGLFSSAAGLLLHNRFEPPFSQLQRSGILREGSGSSAPTTSSLASASNNNSSSAVINQCTLTTQDIKPDLDQLNCALQHQQAMTNAMAALQSSKDVAANLMALSAFGAAPFLIPLVPQSSANTSCGSPRLMQATAGATSSSNCSGGGVISLGNNSGVQQPLPTTPQHPPMRIFNPEAFCEHCNKEFCNKYFLKIHKANKHGIYSLEVLAGAAAAASASASMTSGPSPITSRPLAPVGTSSNNPTSSLVVSATNFSCLPHQLRPLLHAGSASPPTMSGGENGGTALATTAAATASTNLMLASTLANGGSTGGLIITPSMLSKALPTAVMNPDAFCDICQKEFCNKYFLRKHRYKIHGIQDAHSTSATNYNNPMVMISSTASNQGHFECAISTTLAHSDFATSSSLISSHHTPLASSTSMNNQSQSAATTAAAAAAADLCFELGARDLSAKIAAAAALMQTTNGTPTSTHAKHSIQQIVASTSTSPTTATSGCGQQQRPSSNADDQQLTNITVGSKNPSATTSMIFPPGSVTVAGHVFSPDRLREMGVINLDAFCEICCKEFCNKYFLRTHKANKHGIGTCSASEMSSIMINQEMTLKGSGGHPQLHHKYQSVPLSLVIESSKDGAFVAGGGSGGHFDGRKSATPNSNSSSSSTSSSSNSSGSGCLAHQSVNGHSRSDELNLDQHHQPLVMQSQLSRDAIGLSPELNCDMCNRPFSNLYLLKMHMFYFHNVGDISNMLPSQQQPQQLAIEDVSEIKIESDTASPRTPFKSLMTTTSTPSPTNSSIHHQSLSERASVDIVTAVEKSSTPALTIATGGATLANSNTNITSTASQPLSEDLQKLQTMISELNTSPLANKDSPVGGVKCNICLRDMKNKYFLRAHVMNEHGELHDEDMEAALDLGIVKQEPGCDGEGVIVTPTPIQMDTTTTNMSNSSDSLSRPPTATDMAAATAMTPPPPVLSPALSVLTTTKNINAATSLITDLERFCDLCGKEFCNKYFVQAHKHTVHGLARDRSSDSSPPPPALSQQQPEQHQQQPTPPDESCHTPIPLDKIKTEIGVNPAPLLSSISMSNVHHHHQQHHPNTLAHHHHQHQHHQQQHQHQIQALHALERSHSASSVTGRNFCEICNKELCNKYFMKTHMLKMHGINVDEKSFVNGATIGGVMCDICQKELCSKYFLKVHKQNTHGIQDEPPIMNKENYSSTGPMSGGGGCSAVGNLGGSFAADNSKEFSLGFHPGEVDNPGSASSGNRYFSHYTEVCPLCERRFKSIKWLKTHIVNDHADLAKETGFGDLFGELLFGSASSDFTAAHIGQMRTTSSSSSQHPFLLSPGEMPFNASSIKGIDKMSSTSSSSTATSPNATSPFSQQQHQHQHQQQHHHQHHQLHHQHQTSQHSRHRSVRNQQDNDVISIASAAVGGGGEDEMSQRVGDAGQVHGQGQAGVVHELGSTGAAVVVGASLGSAAPITTSAAATTAAGTGGASAIGTLTSLQLPSQRMASSITPGPRKPLTSGNGTRIYHCSYCTYSTRWLSNLYAHEKRHTGLSSEGEKRFSCRVCHRAYRYNHSLQRHLISHKGPGILLKHAIIGGSGISSGQHQSSTLMMSSSQHHHPQNVRGGGIGSGSTNHHEVSISASRPQEPSAPGAMHDCLAPGITLPAGASEHLHYPEDGDEETEEHLDHHEKKSFKFQKFLSGVSSNVSSESTMSAATRSTITGPGAVTGTGIGGKSSSVSRVKKYRCSKCGAKYKTREQCLEHIHLYHNTRNRLQQQLQQHQQHQTNQQQMEQEENHGGNASTNDAGGDASSQHQEPKSQDSSPKPQQQQQQIHLNSQVQVHNCPRCTFTSNSREVLVGHLARHHCGSQDDQDDRDEDNDGAGDINQRHFQQQYHNEDDIGRDNDENRHDQDDVDDDNDDDDNDVDQGALMVGGDNRRRRRRRHRENRHHREQDMPCFAGNRSQMPMTYAVPQTPPSAGSFIMQPFLMSQPDVIDNATGESAGGTGVPSTAKTFVPSLVYLPVSHKLTDSVTVSFNLTPA